MAQLTYTFARVEKKYLLTEAQYTALMERLSPYLTADAYGNYTLCNIYYDTHCYDLIRRSLDKPVYKEKIRLRSYGVVTPEAPVFLELKKKYEGIVYKRRIKLPYHSAYAYLAQGVLPATDSQIFREIDYFVRFYQPHPAVYLAYDREAYFAQDDPELRVTFDRNIRYRLQDLHLDTTDSGERLLPEGKVLLELKLPATMPLWLTAALTDVQARPTSFSKYGNIYQKEYPRLFGAALSEIMG